MGCLLFLRASEMYLINNIKSIFGLTDVDLTKVHSLRGEMSHCILCWYVHLSVGVDDLMFENIQYSLCFSVIVMCFHHCVAPVTGLPSVVSCQICTL